MATVDTAKASECGFDDAQTWMSETPRELWADAIKPGVCGADEALINALGRSAAVRELGGVPGLTETEQRELFHAYSIAWASTALEAIDD